MSTGFNPSETQLAAARAFQASDYVCSIAQAMATVGLTADCYHKWFARDATGEFAAWWRAEAERHFGKLLPRMYGALARQATGNGDGNPTAMKTYLERFDDGFTPRTKTDTNLSATVGYIDLKELSDDEVARLEHVLATGDDLSLQDGIKAVREDDGTD